MPDGGGDFLLATLIGGWARRSAAANCAWRQLRFAKLSAGLRGRKTGTVKSAVRFTRYRVREVSGSNRSFEIFIRVWARGSFDRE
jgi:hypothetical protein